MSLDGVSGTGQEGGPGSWEDQCLLQNEHTGSPQGTLETFPQVLSSESISAHILPGQAGSNESEGKLTVMYKQAKSFLEKGDFDGANNSLNLAVIEAQSLGISDQDALVIHLDRAIVRIYRGQYQQGKTDLERIRETISKLDFKEVASESLKTELDIYCHIWLATCMVWTGKWEEADTKMRYLLEKFPEPPIMKIHMTLALACGHLGWYRQAYSSLKDVFEYLKRVKSEYTT
ncbi:hypothetical protein F5X99DRAFT_404325 [Biscogniauxia marginata]|nr:hypothetical protein F5X99DRAFT_404325 [Biscogniauxia marginata]